MTKQPNFTAAFTAGLERAEVAKKTRAEIEGVVNAVSESIGEITSEAVTLRLIPRALAGPSALGAGLAMAFMATTMSSATDIVDDTDCYLIARGKQGRQIRIARLRLASMGYPIELDYAGKSVHVGERDGLEKAFVGFLQNPLVVAKILEAVDGPLPAVPPALAESAATASGDPDDSDADD